MPLLLLPLLPVAIVLLYLMLLPLVLWQRYRVGHARRRAQAWAIGINAWLLAVSAASFLLGAWIAGRWVDNAVPLAVSGLAAGALLGILGLALTRFERDARGLYFTPDRWLALALTLLVAGRIAYGLWHAWQWLGRDTGATMWLAGQGTLLGVGGLLLGYYLAYTWGLRARLRR